MSGEEKENQTFEEDNQKFLGIKKHSYHLMAIFTTTNRLFDGMMYLLVRIPISFPMKMLLTSVNMHTLPCSGRVAQELSAEKKPL